MAFAPQLDHWLQSFTKSTSASNSAYSPSFVTESMAVVSGDLPVTKLERLLQEEDTLFEQLLKKRAEIRHERVQLQNGENILKAQSHAVGIG